MEKERRWERRRNRRTQNCDDKDRLGGVSLGSDGRGFDTGLDQTVPPEVLTRSTGTALKTLTAQLELRL